MKAYVLFLSLILLPGAVLAQQKTVAYNNLSPGGRTPLDQTVHDALDSQYDVVDFELAKHAYVSPRPIAGTMPDTPKGGDGKPLHGYVMLAYVITLDGRAASPTVIKCTDPTLCVLAKEATLGWRFNIATLDGKKISTVALQEFNF